MDTATTAAATVTTDKATGDELAGFKIFPILRYTAALINTPCPVCNGQNRLDERDYCVQFAQHQIPTCKSCLDRLPRVVTAALHGLTATKKVHEKRHEI